MVAELSARPLGHRWRCSEARSRRRPGRGCSSTPARTPGCRRTWRLRRTGAELGAARHGGSDMAAGGGRRGTWGAVRLDDAGDEAHERRGDRGRTEVTGGGSGASPWCVARRARGRRDALAGGRGDRLLAALEGSSREARGGVWSG